MYSEDFKLGFSEALMGYPIQEPDNSEYKKGYVAGQLVKAQRNIILRDLDAINQNIANVFNNEI